MEDKCEPLAFFMGGNVTVQYSNTQCAIAVKEIRYTESLSNMCQDKWQPFWSNDTTWSQSNQWVLTNSRQHARIIGNMFVWENPLCELYHSLLVSTLVANRERDKNVLEAKLSALSFDTLKCVLHSDNLRWESNSESDVSMRIVEFGRRFMAMNYLPLLQAIR
uniref:AlNc14C51G3979 protein n=1 Tax=Albugo laibachii Nc14 TaxID=890382 RepID=F0WBD2_9STRA|nr:AlNc14C51G3979 [Albugo laibachii Nc14]|eukprot:CCA18456.1 AlNc14C51G3979 [Albugo laibachii Nc14]